MVLLKVHMSCSYCDITMYSYDLKALSYVPAVKCWKLFRYDSFKKIQFTISCPNAKISSETARQPRVKMDFKATSFLTEFNTLLPDLNTLIKNRLPLLYSDPKMKIAFAEKSIKAIYKRGKNLKEMLSP